MICLFSVLTISWTTPVSLSSNGMQKNPSFSVDGSGNAIIAWTDVTNYNVVPSIYENGNRLQPKVLSKNYSDSPSTTTSGTEYFVSWIDLQSGHIADFLTVGSSPCPFILSGGSSLCPFILSDGSFPCPFIVSDGRFNVSPMILRL